MGRKFWFNQRSLSTNPCALKKKYLKFQGGKGDKGDAGAMVRKPIHIAHIASSQLIHNTQTPQTFKYIKLLLLLLLASNGVMAAITITVAAPTRLDGEKEWQEKKKNAQGTV